MSLNKKKIRKQYYLHITDSLLLVNIYHIFLMKALVSEYLPMFLFLNSFISLLAKKCCFLIADPAFFFFKGECGRNIYIFDKIIPFSCFQKLPCFVSCRHRKSVESAYIFWVPCHGVFWSWILTRTSFENNLRKELTNI